MISSLCVAYKIVTFFLMKVMFICIASATVLFSSLIWLSHLVNKLRFRSFRILMINTQC